MKIAVFGATGGIGSQVVKYALEKGYGVVAYVRNPSKMTPQPALTIIKGEVDNYDGIKSAIKGCDAVVNALGLSMKPFQKDYPAVKANELIIRAMNQLGVKRYVAWGTPSVHAEGDAKSYITVLPSIMAGLFLPGAKKALVRIAKEIVASNLNWTIVRFMAPKDTPATGNIKISFGNEKLNFNIARADIAHFMVNQLSSDRYIHKMPIIGS